MKIIISCSRFIVGLLFIFSGLIKANDPLGLSYKMQEFFEVWKFQVSDHLTLWVSIAMIVFEIVAGVAILLGWRMKLFSWLLLLLIVFFTFLTGYAYLSGKIRACGCFGDCIPLTAGQSFAKDIFLLAIIIFLFVKKRIISPVFGSNASKAILLMTAIATFSFQWFVLQHLPVLDCLPYKTGANIVQNMHPPAGAIADSTTISFVYKKNDKEVEFTADKFPADFDDSYKFVKRYDKLVRKGNAEPPIKDFNLVTVSNNDSTQALLTAKGFAIFLFARDMPVANPSWNKDFGVILSLAKQKSLPVYLITSDLEGAQQFIQNNGLSNVVIPLTCDATAIKTAARVNPTLYLLKQGTILNKWSDADFDKAIWEINGLPQQAGNAVP